MPESKRPLPLDDQATFVMSFVDDSRQDSREDMEPIWHEVEQSFLVRPLEYATGSQNTAQPLDQILGSSTNHSRQGRAILKDPETHQEVMTIVAKIVLSLFGEPGFVKAKGVGGEDVFKGSLVSKLIEYLHRKPGHYMAFVEWVLSTCIYGTGILEEFWDFKEEPRNFRSVDVDEFDGRVVTTDTTMVVPVYDDPKFVYRSVRDFFPDTGANSLNDAKGAAVRYKLTAMEARELAKREIWDAAKVESAIETHASMEEEEDRDHPSEDQSDIDPRKDSHSDFRELKCFRYVGMVPFPTKDGVQKRVIQVLEGMTVQSDPWPRPLPFFDCRIIPRLGSFWGIGPGEVIRHDQDFADTIKMMLADAVVRAVHPPPIYDKNADVDVQKLRRWRPDVPIGANHVGAVTTAQYNPPVRDAFTMYGGVKQQMREATGALGAIQGLGLGTKRFSATEAGETFQQALDKPELYASIIEREYLPPIGSFSLSLFQEFLEPGTDDLQRRVGETAFPVDISEILGDFDIEFVGSRREGSVAQEIAAFREIAQAGATNPILQQITPWIPLVKKWYDRLGAHEIAAMVGNPQLVQLHMMLMQLANPAQEAGNGNDEAIAGPPIGQLPAQGLGQAQ